MSKQESGHDTGILRSDMDELAQAAADATRRALVAEAKLAALEAQIAALEEKLRQWESDGDTRRDETILKLAGIRDWLERKAVTLAAEVRRLESEMARSRGRWR